jgi:hypothetical protein
MDDVQRSDELLSQLMKTEKTLWSAILLDDANLKDNLHSFFHCIGCMFLHTFQNMEWTGADKLFGTVLHSFRDCGKIEMTWFEDKNKKGYDQALCALNGLRGVIQKSLETEAIPGPDKVKLQWLETNLTEVINLVHSQDRPPAYVPTPYSPGRGDDRPPAYVPTYYSPGRGDDRPAAYVGDPNLSFEERIQKQLKSYYIDAPMAVKLAKLKRLA